MPTTTASPTTRPHGTQPRLPQPQVIQPRVIQQWMARTALGSMLATSSMLALASCSLTSATTQGQTLPGPLPSATSLPNQPPPGVPLPNVISGSPASDPAAAPVEPYSLEAAQQIAVAGQRDVLVLVTADWCPHCQQMKAQVLPTVFARGGMQQMVYAEVNFDRQPELARALMHGESLPQTVCLKFHNDRWIRAALIPQAADAEKIISMIEWVRALPLLPSNPQPLLPPGPLANASIPQHLPDPASHARQ